MSLTSRILVLRLAGINAKQSSFLFSPSSRLFCNEEVQRMTRIPQYNSNKGGLFGSYYAEQINNLPEHERSRLQPTEWMKFFAKKYNDLGEQEKAELRIKYAEQMAKLKDQWISLSEPERAAIEEEAKLKRKLKQMRQLKKERKQTKPPKVPLTSYARFLQQWFQNPENGKQYSTFGDRCKAASEAYRKLTPNELNKLQEIHSADSEVYKAKKAEWIARLAEEDKLHLVGRTTRDAKPKDSNRSLLISGTGNKTEKTVQ